MKLWSYNDVHYRNFQVTRYNTLMVTTQRPTAHEIREAILDLVQQRGPEKSVCPSEVARRLATDDWRALMDTVRTMAHRLVEEGRILVTQGGRPVDIRTTKGAVRLQLRPPTVGTEPIRFVLDVHLGKLARRLRLLGFDTLYQNDYDDPEIVAIAAAEGRTVLTRDTGIIKRRAVTRGYLVQSTDPDTQLHEVLAYYKLHDQLHPFHRCIACNGPLQSVEKATILDRLEPKTIRYYNTFFQCTDCGKVYWQGSHYERMQAFVVGLGAKHME